MQRHMRINAYWEMDNLLSYRLVIAMQLPVVLGLSVISAQAAVALRAPSFRWISVGWLANSLYLLTAFIESVNYSTLRELGTETFVLASSVLFWGAAYSNSKESLWRILRLAPPAVGALALAVFAWKFLLMPDVSTILRIIRDTPSVLFDVAALAALHQHIKARSEEQTLDTLEETDMLQRGILLYLVIQPIALASEQTFNLDKNTWNAIGFSLGLFAKSFMFFGLTRILIKAAEKSASAEAIAQTKSRIFHELGTPVPLLEVQLYALQKIAPKGLRSRIRDTRETATRANALLNATGETEQILLAASLSKEELSELESEEPKPQSINTLIEVAWLSVKHTRTEGVKLECNYSGNCCVVLRKVAGVQIFVNILRNSYDAFPNGEGYISARTENLEVLEQRYSGVSRGPLGWVKVTFTDDGEGIQQRPIETVLNDSVSTRGSKDQGRGWGLGITKKLVEKHAGKLFFRSPVKPEEENRPGTEVVLIFPRVHCKQQEAN